MILDTASIAGIRFLAGVNALVVVQRGQFLEAPAALVTFVWSLVAVVQEMFVVRLLEGERFAAQVAAVRCLSCQSPQIEFSLPLFWGLPSIFKYRIPISFQNL